MKAGNKMVEKSNLREKAPRSFEDLCDILKEDLGKKREYFLESGKQTLVGISLAGLVCSFSFIGTEKALYPPEILNQNYQVGEALAIASAGLSAGACVFLYKRRKLKDKFGYAL